MIRFHAAGLAALLSSISLGGCMSVDVTDNATPELQSEVMSLDAPELWVFEANSDKRVAASWAEIIKDEPLTALMEEALISNPSLRASAEGVARAQALLAQSRSGLLPILTAATGANGGGFVDEGTFDETYSAGLSASWEADLWGGIRAGGIGAGYDLEGSKAVYRSSRETLIANVARAYVIMIEARKQLELSEATLAAQLDTLRIVSVRYDLGAASRREIVLATSDVASARDNVATVKAAKTNAVLALQALLGRYPDGGFPVPADFPTVTPAIGTGRPSELIHRRPDILAAEYNVLSAFAATRAAETRRWPDLSLSADLDGAAANSANLLDPASLTYSIGARLAATLFDGGLTTARIDAATANQRQALTEYGQTVLNGYQDVETALQTLGTLEERVIYTEQGAVAAREALDLAEIQYQQGAIDLLDVLTFRQRSFQADSTKLSVERQVLETRIALYLALGGAAPSLLSSR